VRIDAVTVGENRIALGDLCVRCRAITAWLGLRDLAVILKLNFQIFNQLGQPFARKGVAGLQGQSASLRQLPVELFAISAVHVCAPAKQTAGPVNVHRQLHTALTLRDPAHKPETWVFRLAEHFP